jgi:hypothetical protein
MTLKKLILDELKTLNLKVIVSKVKSITVKRYSGGSSLNIYTENLTIEERETLDLLTEKYEYGSFDGMQDLYTHKKESHELAVKYVLIHNEQKAG